MTSNTTTTPTTDIPVTPSAPETEYLGPYRLDALLGEQNGCPLFAATHRRRLHRVSVSVLPALAGDDLETLEREIAVAERLNHPSVARVLESGESKGHPYVAFEHIDGITVQDVVRKEGKLSEEVACAIIRHAAIGLHHIHENGLLHGGVRPSNMIITRAGVVKILGLGVSAHTTALPSQPDSAETANYLAPEQLAEHGEPRSDIYGLGCSLYFMLTGENPPSCIELEESGDKTDLNKLAPKTSPALASVVRAMMATDPTKRVQLLTQVVGAMCNWASEETLPALVALHSRDDDTTPPYTQPDPVEETVAKKTVPDVKDIEFASPHKPKSSIGPAVGMLALALAASYGGFLYLASGQPALVTDSRTDLSSSRSATTFEHPSTDAAPKRTTNASASAETIQTSAAPQENEGKVRVLHPVVEQLGTTQPEQVQAVPVRTAGPQQVANVAKPPVPTATPSEVAATSSTGQETPAEAAPSIEVTQPIELDKLGQPSTETKLTAIGKSSTDHADVLHDESVDAYHNRLERQLHEDYGLTGGKWVLTPNEFALISSVVSYGQTVTQDETTEKEDFGRLVRMHVAGKGAKPWAAGLYIPDVDGIEKGDRVLAVVWMRTAPGSRSDGKVSIFVESASDHKKEVYLTVKPTSEWRQFMIPFQAKIARDLKVGFHLAFQKQNIDYGGLTLINFGKTAPFWNAIPAGAKRRKAD